MKKIEVEAQKRLGIVGEFEMVKGRGYFYFYGDEPSTWYSSSVLVYRLNDMNLDEWVDSVKSLKEDWRNM